jgi:hypothetical protein
MARRVLVALLSGAALLGAGQAWLQQSPAWACLGCGAAGLAWAVAGGRGRVLAFNVGAVALVAFAGLVYLEQRQSAQARQQTFSDAPRVFVEDPVLGHRPAPHLHTTATLDVGGVRSYAVTYNTDADALRVSPPSRPEDPLDCVLFFGCSYTFGEGVEDDETLPYRVGVLAGGRYRVRNFGYSGYGPHQMLAAIESGLVERSAGCEPKFAIYQSHPHHVLRASGNWWWDRRGPRYAMRGDGRVERVGSFADLVQADSWETRLLRRDASQPPAFDFAEADVDDIRLFHGIVRQSHELLAKRYPGIAFHVLHWDVEPPPVFQDGWWVDAVTVHRLSGVLPLQAAGWEDELLLPRDVHPTAATHDAIATYVVRAILHLEPASALSSSRVEK